MPAARCGSCVYHRTVIQASDTRTREADTRHAMRYADDLVRASEIDDRATALLAWAVCSDSRVTNDPVGSFADRGWSRYSHFTKSAVAAVSSTDTAVALQPLRTAFVAAVDRLSIFGGLDGALRLPLTALARLQVGTVTATEVAEGQIKPIGRFDFELSGTTPTKVEASIVATAEALRSLDPATQAGMSAHLVSAAAAATDVSLIARLTTGSPAASADPGTLLQAISGGAPRRPYLIGSYETLVPLAGTLRDLRELGVGILVTPAAAGMLIAVDAAGLLLSDGGATVEVSRHADILMDDGGSPAGTTVVSLWQRNLQAVRAERWIRVDFRADAVAFATVTP